MKLPIGEPRDCAVCGARFPLSFAHRVTCSDECKQKWKTAQNRARAWRGIEDRDCAVCGASFRYHPKLRTTYCSKDCKVAGVNGMTLRQLMDHRAARPNISKTATCAQCGRAFIRRADPRHGLCSEACRVLANRAYSRVRSSKRKPLVERVCKECDERFIPGYGDKRRTYCSADCAARYNRRLGKRTGSGLLRRRSLRRVRDRREKVVALHGGRCGICRRPIDRTLHWTHPLSLTIDHIHPLSAGGTDDIANLWPAHRKCNEDKGDDIGWVTWAAAA